MPPTSPVGELVSVKRCLSVLSGAMLFRSFLSSKARWQSGHAADCNSVYAGSIPTRASIIFQVGANTYYKKPPYAWMVELVDTGDLKSPDRKVVPVQFRL
jgi:hypothetical protein